MQEHAEYLRLLLAMGLVTRAEIVAWADSQIEAMDDPPIQLIEVALGGNLIVEDLMKLLELLRGNVNVGRANLWVLRVLRDGFRRGRFTLAELSRHISSYSEWALISEEQKYSVGYLTEIERLFEMGLHGTLESVHLEIERFFALHASDPLQ